MGLNSDEVEIKGAWVMVNGRMTEDDASRRINSLIKTELEHVATSKDGWEQLYRDTQDGRYWEWFHPQSEMQGGGPPALRVISREVAEDKYRLA